MTTRRRAFMAAFLALDRLGIHVLPKHYYTSIPDYRWLRENMPLWSGRASLIGVDWNLDDQLEWLRSTCAPYRAEIENLSPSVARLRDSPGYGLIEAQVLHCFIRRVSPRRIVEIGSGSSTAVMAAASRMNTQRAEITAIDPYPSTLSQRLPIELIRRPVQEFAATSLRLGSGDLLFIDSTHAVKIGSDVVHLYIDIIPALPAGVFIHIHDSYLPYVYPRSALNHVWGHQETALCLALLKWNSKLRVLCSESALHYDRPDELKEILPSYVPQSNPYEGLAGDGGLFPSSLWLQTR